MISITLLICPKYSEVISGNEAFSSNSVRFLQQFVNAMFQLFVWYAGIEC